MGQKHQKNRRCKILFSKVDKELGVVTQACDPSTREAEAGGSLRV